MNPVRNARKGVFLNRMFNGCVSNRLSRQLIKISNGMNYNFSNYKKQLERPEVIFFLACFGLIVFGILTMGINYCQLGSFMYGSGRLDGAI